MKGNRFLHLISVQKCDFGDIYTTTIGQCAHMFVLNHFAVLHFRINAVFREHELYDTFT